MTKVLVVGSGKIGRRVASNLATIARHDVTLAGRARPPVLPPGALFVNIDASDRAQMAQVAKKFDLIVNACPHYLNLGIATVAKDVGAHYFDLSESATATNAIRELAKGAKTVLMPQCGFAPGFMGVIASHLIKQMDSADTVELRVGCVPQVKSNRLGYGKMWSTEGVVHEYMHSCLALENGRVVELKPLEGLERVVVDGMEWEAFNTSGCIGSLCETFAGKITNLNFKSMRYPGHCELIRFLVHDLRFSEREEELVSLLNRALADVYDDLLVIVVAVEGGMKGRRTRKVFSKTYRGTGKEGETAVEIATAAGICATIDLFLRMGLPQSGFVKQEEANYVEYMKSPFAAPLAADGR